MLVVREYFRKRTGLVKNISCTYCDFFLYIYKMYSRWKISTISIQICLKWINLRNFIMLTFAKQRSRTILPRKELVWTGIKLLCNEKQTHVLSFWVLKFESVSHPYNQPSITSWPLRFILANKSAPCSCIMNYSLIAEYWGSKLMYCDILNLSKHHLG